MPLCDRRHCFGVKLCYARREFLNGKPEMSEKKDKTKIDTTELSDEELEKAQGGFSFGVEHPSTVIKPKGSPNQIRIGHIGPNIPDLKNPTKPG